MGEALLSLRDAENELVRYAKLGKMAKPTTTTGSRPSIHAELIRRLLLGYPLSDDSADSHRRREPTSPNYSRRGVKGMVSLD